LHIAAPVVSGSTATLLVNPPMLTVTFWLPLVSVAAVLATTE